MKARRYANAADVLPAALAWKLARYVRGRVGIPVRRRRRFKTAGDAARNRRIRELAGQGWTVSEIAEEVRLCKERVRQILSPRSTGSCARTSRSAARSRGSSEPETRA